ncbi:MAG: hypothetical protein IJ751_06405 [Oscillospiraceae bacterium]|nr:hypothetical protein [Oscillospiraceae bacterium]
MRKNIMLWVLLLATCLGLAFPASAAELETSTAPAMAVASTQAGWVKQGGVWYYYRDGHAVTVWLKDGKKWYYFNADGAMQTGWQKVGRTWYYLAAGGEMQTGWLKDGGKWYYLNADGAMQTGWQKVGGTWYYLSTDGAMQTGWQKVNGAWYYLAAGGEMQTGWQKVGGKWYYLNADGAMQTGWLKDGGTWYYLSADGAMQTGWQKVNGTWYFLAAGGEMQTGWQKSGGEWYYLDNSGAMQTGWLETGNHLYFLADDGVMLRSSGWVIDGEVYTFDANGYATPEVVANDPWRAYELEVVLLVNEIRVENGLDELEENWYLSRVARYKSADFRDKGYFDHQSPTYGSPFEMMQAYGIDYMAAGENIAYGYPTPESVVTAWMNSPGHRANILNGSFTTIGVGCVQDDYGIPYWTQMFIG